MISQNLKRNTLSLSICAALILSAGCTVKIKDHEFCADAGKLGATCFNLLSDGERDVPKDKWEIERFGMVCETPEAFADLKSVIESLCENTKSCTYEQKQKVNAFFNKLDAVKAKAKKK